MGYKIIRPRRGIKSLWDAYKDKIYKTGEMLVESPESGVGTGPVNVKFGDGITPYYNLPYAIEAPINQAIEGSTKPITSGAVYEQNKKIPNMEYGIFKASGETRTLTLKGNFSNMLFCNISIIGSSISFMPRDIKFVAPNKVTFKNDAMYMSNPTTSTSEMEFGYMFIGE